jgi:hypothetical protein
MKTEKIYGEVNLKLKLLKEEEIYQKAKQIGMSYKLSPNEFISIIKRVLKRKLKENEK